MALSESLFLAKDRRGWHVITKAGYILCTGSTRWRAGAVSQTWTELPQAMMLRLHDDLAMTTWYCPASGTLLWVDTHRRDDAAGRCGDRSRWIDAWPSRMKAIRHLRCERREPQATACWPSSRPAPHGPQMQRHFWKASYTNRLTPHPMRRRAPMIARRPITRSIEERDVAVAMRDGVKLSVDVYRPKTDEKLPALLAFAVYNKDLQAPEIAAALIAAAGLVAAVDRLARSRRHPLSHIARLCACDRRPARLRQVGGRRLARMGFLRPDRVDRGAALVRRQCRHGRHFRLRRRAVPRRQAAAAPPQGDLSIRSARRLRHARLVPRGISRRRAASVPLSSVEHQHRRASEQGTAGSNCRRSARRCGARRCAIPTT